MDDSSTDADSSVADRPMWVMVIVGVGLTFAANAVTFVLFTTLAPRRNEGIRSVVDVEWEPYVTLAHATPLILVYITSNLFFPNTRARVVIIIAAAVTMFLWANYHHADLLRRDFIGKF